MRVMRTTVMLMGWLTAFSAQAEQPHSRDHRQYDAFHGNDSSAAIIVVPGLLGNYPITRETPGTAWQPDSTPIDYRHERNYDPEAGATLAGDSIWLIRHQSAGTFGLQAEVAVEASRAADSTRAHWFTDADSALMHVPEHQSTYRLTVVNLAATYNLPLTRRSSVFGYMGLPGEPAFGPAASYLRRFSDMDHLRLASASDWEESSRASSRVVTLGYVWRNLKVESSAFSSRDPDRKRARAEWRRLTSKRLSFNPTRNWALQISRGHISNLDQLEPNQHVRRTTVSATYNRAFTNVNWQTTLAWGRSSRRMRESTMGYLLESTLKVRNAHAFFGRMEEVGSDDLFRENESLDRKMFKMNKVTVGYLYDARSSGPIKYDIGALMNRHLVPSAMTASYGDDPTSYMMFVRLRLR